jgi:hypothetical protein
MRLFVGREQVPRESVNLLRELRTVEEVLGLFLFQRHLFGADSPVSRESQQVLTRTDQDRPLIFILFDILKHHNWQSNETYP